VDGWTVPLAIGAVSKPAGPASPLQPAATAYPLYCLESNHIAGTDPFTLPPNLCLASCHSLLSQSFRLLFREAGALFGGGGRLGVW
jgi:hypothetical protein